MLGYYKKLNVVRFAETEQEALRLKARGFSLVSNDEQEDSDVTEDADGKEEPPKEPTKKGGSRRTTSKPSDKEAPDTNTENEPPAEGGEADGSNSDNQETT